MHNGVLPDFVFQSINAQYEATQNELEVQRKEFQSEQKQITEENKSLKSEWVYFFVSCSDI